MHRKDDHVLSFEVLQFARVGGACADVCGSSASLALRTSGPTSSGLFVRSRAASP